MALFVCPVCEAELNLEGVEVGEIVECEECGAELEVDQGVSPSASLAGGGGSARMRFASSPSSAGT